MSFLISPEGVSVDDIDPYVYDERRHVSSRYTLCDLTD